MAERRVYSAESKLQAIAEWKAGASLGGLGAKFGAPKPTVQRWVKGLQRMRRAHTAAVKRMLPPSSQPTAVTPVDTPASPAALALRVSRGKWQLVNHLYYGAVIVYGMAREADLDPTGRTLETAAEQGYAPTSMLTVCITPTRVYGIRPPAGQPSTQ